MLRIDYRFPPRQLAMHVYHDLKRVEKQARRKLADAVDWTYNTVTGRTVVYYE